ncbi:MAG: 3-keto-disaccharide hydrolase [Blastocatellia bacterium]
MKRSLAITFSIAAGMALLASLSFRSTVAQKTPDALKDAPRAFIDGVGPGWRTLGQEDFARVNCDADTFTWRDGVITCTGKPIGVMRTLSPNGSRGFPRKNLSNGFGQWNYYYVRAINGEVRLWVNGEEVSGGNGCEPRVGYLCLESEGAPIEFRNLRVRELP